MKPAIFAAITLLGLSSPLIAGPFEDADAAYDKGDYATALRLVSPLEVMVLSDISPLALHTSKLSNGSAAIRMVPGPPAALRCSAATTMRNGDDMAGLS